MNLREMQRILEVGKLDTLIGTVYGKSKDDPLDADQYADYIAASAKSGLAGNLLVVGAPGTGKSRGFCPAVCVPVRQAAESIVLTDPKAELFESMAGYLDDQGYEVRGFQPIGYGPLGPLEPDRRSRP